MAVLNITYQGMSADVPIEIEHGVSDNDIVELNIPTGIPLVYELDAALKPIRSYYLGDAEAAKRAAEAVAKQGSGPKP